MSIGEENRGPKSKNFSVFLQTIRKAAQVSAGVHDANPFRDASFEGLGWSAQYLRFGGGVVDPTPPT